MRFLKNKISLSQQLKTKQEIDKTSSPSTADYSIHEENSPQSLHSQKLNIKLKAQRAKKTKYHKTSTKISREKPRCTKNIVKNYGKTVATFACSQMALPYLKPLLEEENVQLCDAKVFFNQAKTAIQGIDTFRGLILAMPQDSSLEGKLKSIFQKIGEIFIKFFSVNWIYHSKIRHRKTYLEYRFKMLRRLRNPEMFTYLKG